MYTIILASNDDAISHLNNNDIEHEDKNKISKAIDEHENLYLVNGEAKRIETESELISKLYKHNVVSNIMIFFNLFTIILFAYILYTVINQLINDIDHIVIFSASFILNTLIIIISFFLVLSSALDIKDAINTKKQISKHNKYIKNVNSH